MKLRSPQILRPHQKSQIQHIWRHHAAMIWGYMGSGKTISTLSAITHLLDTFEIRGVLVIATARVAQTVWKQEAAAWEHTAHLRCRIVHGLPPTRLRAIMTPADVYISNYENLPWLVRTLQERYLDRGRPLPFDMVVFDEITMAKSTRTRQGSTRMAPLYKEILYPKLNRQIKRRVGLTGTPLPNGYQDLFGQYLVLDEGLRFGTSHSNWISRFFRAIPNTRKLEVTDNGKQVIHQLIGDITLDIPAPASIGEPTENEITVVLDAKTQARYDKLEKQFFLELDSGIELDVDSVSSLYNKLLQFANGAVYTDDLKSWETVHDAKLNALEELLDEASDPVLLAYQYRHDAERIMDRFKGKVVWVNAKVGSREMQKITEDWNEGKLPILMGHPASIGHGLNLQYGSHTIAWFGLNWRWDLYTQFNSRLHGRHGQKYQVMVHHLLTAGTLEYMVRAAMRSKQADESGLRNAINEYRRNKYGQTAA